MSEETVRMCPVEGAAMQKEDVVGVTIDRCPTCGGVFLDAGELQSIKDRCENSYSDGEGDGHDHPDRQADEGEFVFLEDSAPDVDGREDAGGGQHPLDVEQLADDRLGGRGQLHGPREAQRRADPDAELVGPDRQDGRRVRVLGRRDRGDRPEDAHEDEVGQHAHGVGDQLGGDQQTFVQRPVRVQLVGRLGVAAPETVATATDVPVAKPINELVQPGASSIVVLGVHPLGHRGHRAIQFAQDPAIQFATLGGRPIFSSARHIGRR